MNMTRRQSCVHLSLKNLSGTVAVAFFGIHAAPGQKYLGPVGWVDGGYDLDRGSTWSP